MFVLSIERYRGMPEHVRAEFDQWLTKADVDVLSPVVAIHIDRVDTAKSIGTGVQSWRVRLEYVTAATGRGKNRKVETAMTPAHTVDEFAPACSWRYFKVVD